MNIHYSIVDGVIASIPTGQYRARTGERKPTKKGTQTPRTRSNVDAKLPHNAYPGGKRLRKAMSNLARRQRAHEATTGGSTKGRTLNVLAFQKPGSMRMRG